MSALSDSDPVVVVATGDLDCASIDDLVDRTTHALEWGAPVVIDMAQVPFVDSSGLTGLLVLQQRASERGTSISLHHLRRQARELLELTGLDRVLPVVPG